MPHRVTACLVLLVLLVPTVDTTDSHKHNNSHKHSSSRSNRQVACLLVEGMEGIHREDTGHTVAKQPHKVEWTAATDLTKLCLPY